MATGVVHSQTLTVMKRSSKQPQKIPVTPGRSGRREVSGVHPWRGRKSTAALSSHEMVCGAV